MVSAVRLKPLPLFQQSLRCPPPQQILPQNSKCPGDVVVVTVAGGMVTVVGGIGGDEQKLPDKQVYLKKAELRERLRRFFIEKQYPLAGRCCKGG